MLFDLILDIFYSRERGKNKKRSALFEQIRFGRSVRRNDEGACISAGALWFFSLSGPGLIHSAHSGAAGRSSGFGDVGHQGFGGQHHGRDGSRVLQGAAGDLGRIDDAAIHHEPVCRGLFGMPPLYFKISRKATIS